MKKRFALLIVTVMMFVCLLSACKFEYTVTFDYQNGTTETVVFDGNFQLPDKPTMEGKTFGGWYIDKQCTQLWNTPQTLNKSITVYAKWTTNSGPSNPGDNDNPSGGNQSGENPGGDIPGETPSGGETSYKLAVNQTTLGKTLYATGSIASNYYLKTTETYASAANVHKQTSGSGYYLYFSSGSAKTYINVTVTKGTDNKVHVNIALGASASTVWTDSVSGCISTTATVDGSNKIVYLASYSNHETISARYCDAIPTATDDLAYLTTSENGGNSGGGNSGGGNGGGNSGGETPSDQADTEYTLFVNQGNLGKTLYATGSIANNYYLATSENSSSAATVYKHIVGSGFYLYFVEGSANKYINVAVTKGSDKKTHVNLALDATASTLWTDTVANCISTTATVDGAIKLVYLASYNNYQTISARYNDSAPTSTDFLAQLLDNKSHSTIGEDSGATFLNWNKTALNVVSTPVLQKKVLDTEGNIGLPSVGSYDCLVIPVQFVDANISASDLVKLNKAFNGTVADTGWQSVNTYYKTSSYNNLDLHFDILGVNIGYQGCPYTAAYARSAYDNSNGGKDLLKEILDYLDANTEIDLTHYDTNGDGYIDAVYIIWAGDIDYANADNWWAYVDYWYSEDDQWQGLSANYYLFAGLNFTNEGVSYVTENYPKINGLNINAATFIHETGHLLGLDDYYDYDEDSGSNEGLGGADMMDYTVGDHNKYSKIMLGWLEPTIISSTTENFVINLNNANTNDDCVLIRLDNGTNYFAEYLLIDLYNNKGLNALHAAQDESFLYYDSETGIGATCGVRIYHVSSQITTGYDEQDYYSVTDYNNTSTDIALIKLVEADNESKFESTNGYAEVSDLWQAGDVLSQYARNDGSKVNFTVTIVSVTADTATITVTFA